ncbi:MAG: thymidylate synthase [Nanoarchaeota archaeon]
MEIRHDTCLKTWKAALKYVLEHGKDYVDNAGRTCKEAINLNLIITSPHGDLSRLIDEMNSFEKWVYPSQEEIINIVFAKRKSEAYHYTLGSRIFNFSNVKNQIRDYIIPLLTSDPQSRRAIVMVYDPVEDSVVLNRETPGLVYVHFKVVADRLVITASIRSNDLFVGWPTNLLQVGKLQEHVAEALDIPAGAITTFSNSAHIFKEHAEQIKAVLSR